MSLNWNSVRPFNYYFYMNFYEKLEKSWNKSNSLICVGLDTDKNKIPVHLSSNKFPIFDFNREIIDATADLVCSYKPQIAYYSGQGAEAELKMTIDYILNEYPDIPLILDAKRGDIDSSAEFYAKEAFEQYCADAVTVNPYMGSDTLKPFLDWSEKGVIVLCRTSNPAAKDFQDITVGGKKLFHYIAQKASDEWNYNKNVGLVVGATYPDELAEIRSIIGEMPILTPGIGKQGGDVKAVLKNGLNKNKTGLIINSSRSIIYAGSAKDFAIQARNATSALLDEINIYR